MSKFLDSKRLPAAALAFALTATSSLFAMADAPPGAYLQSTTKSQSLSGSAQKTSTINTASAPNAGAGSSSNGTKYGLPLSDSLNTPSAPPTGYNGGPSPPPYTPAGGNPNYPGQPNFAGQPQSGWSNQNQEPQAFSQQQPSPPYNGYAQQSNSMPPNYPPQQPNYSAPPPNMNGGPPGSDWQADYPSLSELNGGAQQPQVPLNANAQVNVTPTAGGNLSAPKPMIDDATLKTIGAVANTVLPIATTMIMNKMMYGTVAPRMMPMGNYGGYGYNPYGPMGNPMGGYGYNRPNMYNNGMMGGGNGGLGGLLNGHF